jgi:hypothetical protein
VRDHWFMTNRPRKIAFREEGLPHTVVWVEGVDFDEILFDSNRLSVIRGACRALEEMPPLVQRELELAFPGRVKPIAIGGSKAGFVVEADDAAVRKAFAPIRTRLDEQGCDPVRVKSDLDELRDRNMVGDQAMAVLAHAAPFAHLVFHHSIKPAPTDSPGDVERAVEAARAAVRVSQLREPGKRVSYTTRPDYNRPCDFDKQRPVEMTVQGPVLPEDADNKKGSTTYGVSRASAARWYFGRAERQRLYEPARVQLVNEHRTADAEKLAFVDDFQEMVLRPHPFVPDPFFPGTDMRLPVSVESKIAVFVADGDGFGSTIGKLKNDLNAVDGQSVFTRRIDDCMRELVQKLVHELAEMRDDTNGGIATEASYAAALESDASRRHQRDRTHLGADDLLLRFETLLFGGDDLTFVVPAWLGWWLARRFFAISSGWSIAVPGKEPYPIRFSAGMVIAPAKSPIRALKALALDLCSAAKGTGGGLEIEVLESLEPPADGITGLRGKLLGRGWEHDGGSRLTIPREQIEATLRQLAIYWAGADGPGSTLPASQLHRALRAARQEGDIASPEAARAANRALADYADKAGRDLGFKLDDVTCLPRATGDLAALQLHFLLQQRDYVVAGWPFANWQAQP